MKRIFDGIVGSIRNNLVQVFYFILYGLFYYPMADNGKEEFVYFVFSCFLFFYLTDVFLSKKSIKKRRIQITHTIFFYASYLLCVGSFLCFKFWGSSINFYIIFDLFSSIKHYYATFFTFNLELALLLIWLVSFLPIYMLYTNKYYQKITVSSLNKYIIIGLTVLVFTISILFPSQKYRIFLINHPYLYSFVDIMEAGKIKYLTKKKEQKNIKSISNIIVKKTKNDIILITIDALRRDYFYPYPKYHELCPEMFKNLENKDHFFSNSFYSISSYSSCGIPTMLAGNEVEENMIIDLSIFQVMKKLGFETSALLSGNHSGFDNLKHKYGNYIDNYVDGFYDIRHVPTDDRILIKGMDEINWDSTKPKFIWFHLMSVHSAGYKFLNHKHIQPESILEKYVSDYELGVVQATKIIDTIFNELERYNKLNSSTIIITSDHGEMLGKNNALAHSKHLALETLEIPLFIINPKGIDIEFGTQMDIAPMILSTVSNTRMNEWKGYSRNHQRPQNENIEVHSKGKLKTGRLVKTGDKVDLIIN